MTSTQALLPNTLEEFQDGQSLGHLQDRQSLDLSERKSIGDLQDRQSLDLRDSKRIGILQERQSLDLGNRQILGDLQPELSLYSRNTPSQGELQSGLSIDLQEGQSLENLGVALSLADTNMELLEEYEAETELDEDIDDISEKVDTSAKVGEVPEAVKTTFGPNPPSLEPMAEEVVQPSKSPQAGDDQLYLDDVEGFMHQTSILDQNDFEDFTVHELQKQVAEQIAEFENTWYLEQSQALEEKNRNPGEIPRNFLETDLEEEQRLEKRREDFLEELRTQSEAAARAEGGGMPTSCFGQETAFRSVNLPANNVTSVGRSVQVGSLGPYINSVLCHHCQYQPKCCAQYIFTFRKGCPVVFFVSWDATLVTL